MSTFVDIEVACPRCGEVASRSVATSINATRTPAYRSAILNGTFQRFVCAGCAGEVMPILPFAYLDFDRKQFIAVFPSELEARWWEFEHEALEAFADTLGADAPPIAQRVGTGMAVRTVFGMDALREKIVTLTEGLDDATVETLKLRLLLTAQPPPAIEPPPRLTEVDDETLVFAIGRDWGDGEGIVLGPLLASRAEYEAVGADPDLAEMRDALSTGPFRDMARVTRPAPAGVATG